MNQSVSFSPFNIFKSAKLVLFNLMFLSTASLLAPSAFAMAAGYENFSECIDINTNLPRYVSPKGYFFESDYVDWSNEWTLSSSLSNYHNPAYPHFPKDQNGLTNFKLVSIKITTKPYDLKKDGRENVAFPVIKTIACEYQDPSGIVPGSLYLTLKESGRISVGDKKLAEKDMDGTPITDRTVSYVSRGGQVLSQKKWKTDRNATTVTEFTCSDKDVTNWMTHCGGWNMNRKIQNNGFWSYAYYWCNRVWQRCYFNGLLWSYAKDLQATHNKMAFDEIRVPSFADPKCNLSVKTRTETIYIDDGRVPQTVYFCTIPNPGKAYCKEPKCDAEIKAVNNIIGKYEDGREGMAWHIRSCWANPDLKVLWKNKKWEDRFEKCNDISQPKVDWPDYTHLSFPIISESSS